MTILDNPRFAAAFERLAGISLDPGRHTATNAVAHSRLVAKRARALAELNGRDADLLGDLGLAHDIGKLTGTAKMAASIDVLRDLGVTDEALLALVKRHDVNLPWYLAAQKGEAPTDRAWNRLARAVDMELLVLFMVADRVDAPGGWRRNAPLCWFIDQARERGLIGELTFEVPGAVSEISAGGVLVHDARALVIRVRQVWELPKGGIEFGELAEEAAVREVIEETGLGNALRAGAELGALEYDVSDHRKRVRYFALSLESADGGDDGQPVFGPRPSGTRELRWVDAAEAAELPLVSEALRPIIIQALQ
jgi:8-oxo-dGTP pyrophosphatase MutT (NUDIX family)